MRFVCGLQLHMDKNTVQKLLTEAKSSAEKGNKQRATWCCLDAAWFLLAENEPARAALKAASDLIYPKKIASNRGGVRGRRGEYKKRSFR